MPWQDKPCRIRLRTKDRNWPAHTRQLMEKSLNVKLEASEVICHYCDNPLCDEITHLWVGTQTDNLRDAYQKNRLAGSIHRPGELHRFHKLQNQDISKIRELAGQYNQATLANIFKVNQSTISRVINNKRWNNAGG